MNRIVCHFSCGAASAVATKLILGEYDPARVVIYNAFLKEEHLDNRRFLADCARWFNHPITVLQDPEVFEQAARIQEEIGPGAYLFRDRSTQERFSLRELKLGAGRHDELLPDCSFFCAMAEDEF